MCATETDQRGERRPSGTRCDVGAFEVQSTCQGPQDCNDDNECTEDACIGGACVNTALGDGTACSEGACLDRVCAPAGAFSCTEQGIREAIAEGGGPQVFACDGPTRVVTEAELVIDKDLIRDGENNLVVDGRATIACSR